MWLNQRTQDAIRIMAELSANWPRAIKAADLALRTGITFLNVQKTANVLARAGLIEAERGRHGGLRLGIAGRDMPVAAIVRAFEPKDCPVNFLTMEEPNDPLSRLMFQAHRGFFQPLEATTLAEIEPQFTALGTRDAASVQGVQA